MRPGVASTGLVILGMILACILGCSAKPTPPTEEPTPLSKLARLYVVYVEQHQRQGPPDQQTFERFVRGLKPEQLSSYGVDPANLAALFISPRDHEPYVIRYKVRSEPGVTPVLAYERTGVDGKRQVAFLNGEIREVDAAELERLVPGEQK